MQRDKKVKENDLQDRFLLKGVMKQDPKSFEQLVKKYSDAFYRFCYRFLQDKEKTEDILQEAFLKLWAKPQLWDQSHKTKFTSWFYKILMNLCLDEKRKKKWLSLFGFLGEDPRESCLNRLIKEEKQLMLEKEILKLPQKYQTVLHLSYFEGISNQEAADMMGVTVKAFQSTLMRAKNKIKKQLV